LHYWINIVFDMGLAVCETYLTQFLDPVADILKTQIRLAEWDLTPWVILGESIYRQIHS
jgi:hypothetical protein